MSWLRRPVDGSLHERVPPGQTLTTKFPVLHVGRPVEYSRKRVKDGQVGDWAKILRIPGD
jgi:hypothetical protein